MGYLSMLAAKPMKKVLLASLLTAATGFTTACTGTAKPKATPAQADSAPTAGNDSKPAATGTSGTGTAKPTPSPTPSTGAIPSNPTNSTNTDTTSSGNGASANSGPAPSDTTSPNGSTDKTASPAPVVIPQAPAASAAASAAKSAASAASAPASAAASAASEAASNAKENKKNEEKKIEKPKEKPPVLVGRDGKAIKTESSNIGSLNGVDADALIAAGKKQISHAASASSAASSTGEQAKEKQKSLTDILSFSGKIKAGSTALKSAGNGSAKTETNLSEGASCKLTTMSLPAAANLKSGLLISVNADEKTDDQVKSMVLSTVITDQTLLKVLPIKDGSIVAMDSKNNVMVTSVIPAAPTTEKAASILFTICYSSSTLADANGNGVLKVICSTITPKLDYENAMTNKKISLDNFKAEVQKNYATGDFTNFTNVQTSVLALKVTDKKVTGFHLSSLGNSGGTKTNDLYAQLKSPSMVNFVNLICE